MQEWGAIAQYEYILSFYFSLFSSAIALTVRAHKAGSHSGKGWEAITDAIIKAVSTKLEDVVFLLWGKHAQAKANIIDKSKHHILQAAHPRYFDN